MRKWRCWRWMRFLALLTTAAATLTLVACAVEVDSDDDALPALAGSQTPASSQVSATPAPLHVEVLQPTEAILVYSVPPDDPTKAGTVFARVVDSKSAATVGEDRLIGNFTLVKPVESNSPNVAAPPRIMASNLADDRPLEEFALGRDDVSLARSVSTAEASELEIAGPYFVPALVAPNGMSYRATENSITQTAASGAVAETYALPRALPITSPDQLNFGEPMSGGVEIDKLDGARSLLLNGEGHLLVFVDNSVNAVLVDLATDKRLDLPDYVIATATLGQDGYVYAVLLGTDKSGNPYALAQIDPKAMELKQLVETTVRPSEWNGPVFVSLVATPSGDIFFYATLWKLIQMPDQYANTNVFMRLDPSTFKLTPITVPDSLGQRVTVGVDGKIYFYAGPAESTVSAYDPATGELALDLPELRSPPGTYIRALFVR